MKKPFILLSITLLAMACIVACTKEEVPGTDDNNAEEIVKYTIGASVNDSIMGTVEGAGEYENGATCTLTATPYEGYRFVDWNDGVTENPRTITISGDAQYTANFEEIPFEGAEVNFYGDVWTATTVGAGMYNNKLITILYENYNAGNDSRTVYIVGGTSPGTYTGINAGLITIEYYWIYNHLKQVYTLDGQSRPIWVVKEFTQEITAIDLNAKTTTFTAHGTVYNDELYHQNILAELVVRDLYVRVNTQWAELTFGKGDIVQL